MRVVRRIGFGQHARGHQYGWILQHGIGVEQQDRTDTVSNVTASAASGPEIKPRRTTGAVYPTGVYESQKAMI